MGNKGFRAGGMPKEHMDFFQVGVKYRAPRVVPTGFIYVEHFALRQSAPPVKWTIHLPESRRCNQANYVTNRADDVPDESEMVFAPYSVFLVIAVTWSERPWEKPHEIVLQVPVDNRDESDDLPVAPWC